MQNYLNEINVRIFQVKQKNFFPLVLFWKIAKLPFFFFFFPSGKQQITSMADFIPSMQGNNVIIML